MRLLLPLLGMLAACGGSAAYDPDALPPGEFLHSLYFQPEHLVVTSQRDWEIEWPHLSGELTPAPEVDFAHFMVLVAALGERPTSGYQVTIDDVRTIRNDRLAARILETVPGKGCGLLQVATTPAQAITVPRFAGTVEFSQGSRVLDCK
ncbi:MAG TPA: protease complex subunit PrcB family protein [Myxococcales bacterium]|jgi:hypothetical protein|nr:protease complex subunit PrcB family protein [Myxococcales bacterium]